MSLQFMPLLRLLDLHKSTCTVKQVWYLIEMPFPAFKTLKKNLITLSISFICHHNNHNEQFAVKCDWWTAQTTVCS